MMKQKDKLLNRAFIKKEIEQKTNFLLLMFSLRAGIPQISDDLLNDKDYHNLYQNLRKYKRTDEDNDRFYKNTMLLAKDILALKNKIIENSTDE